MEKLISKKGIIYYAYPYTKLTEYVLKKYNGYAILTEGNESYKGTNVYELKDLIEAVKNIPEGGTVIIDNLSRLQNIIKQYAEELFSKSPDGASWKDVQKNQYVDILNIPKGAGYTYYRKAFEKIMTGIFNKAGKVIMVASVKEKQPDGSELFRRYIQYEPDLVNGCLELLIPKTHTVVFVKMVKEGSGLLGILNHYDGYLAGSDIYEGKENIYLDEKSPI